MEIFSRCLAARAEVYTQSFCISWVYYLKISSFFIDDALPAVYIPSLKE